MLSTEKNETYSEKACRLVRNFAEEHFDKSDPEISELEGFSFNYYSRSDVL